MKKPPVLAGLFVGFLLTIALTAILYASNRVAGLPFLPFDAFDWGTRRLPGALVTFGIDTMVGVVRALNVGETSAVAKTAERLVALIGFVAIGTVAGGIAFIAMAWRSAGWRIVGLGVGMVVGLLLALTTFGRSSTSSFPALVRAGWAVVVWLAWGWTLAWAYARLTVGSASARAAASADPYAERVDRRRFVVRLGGATAVVTVGGAVVGALAGGRRRGAVAASSGGGEPWSATHPLPNAGAAVEPVPGTRPEFTPLDRHYRIDINTTSPVVDGDAWRLHVGGLVDAPLSLAIDDLRAFEPRDQFVTLACISNPIGGSLTSTTRWTGVSLATVLERARLRPEATHLRMRSVDGFHEVVALDVVRADPRVMLTYAWDGVPLRIEHGFPLRIYIPDHYGMKQPKWIESIEAIAEWEPGYWVTRGWDREARMNATSVIDAVGTDMMLSQADASTVVPVGGIAHAGARGISRVEVRVDDGPWEPAELRAPLSGTTWVIWRYGWRFSEGQHRLTVRSFEGDGTPQVERMRPVRPSGATGLHSKEAML